jgi:D-sedoheptulose 7-phosphate isomerase
MHNTETYPGYYIETLIQEVKTIPSEKILEIDQALQSARKEGRQVFIIGNGGSAGTASHIACDFAKNTRQPEGKRMKVISLADGLATLTAYANDEGYENVFSEPLLSLAENGDVLLAISGSGNSPNILKALQTARKLGMTTLGITGFQGGKMKEMVDICLVVESESIERIEDAHLIIAHVLTGLLRQGGKEEC